MTPSTTRTPAAIEPFWLRLGKITRYPLQGTAMFIICLYAVFRLVGYLPGFAGAILNVFISAAIYKYASDVLVGTAHGRFNAPEGWTNSEDTVGWVQLKVQGMLLLMMFLVGMLLAPVSLTLAVVAIVFIAFGQPGATMSAATDMNLWLALNPLTWLKVMGRLGWPYFVAAMLCGVISLSQLNAQSLLVPFLPGWMGLIVFYAISHYATIATFHLMGYLIYQYHEELGWEVEHAQVLKRPQDVDQDLLDQAEALAREGNLQGAEDLLRGELASRGGSPGVHDRYRKLVAVRGDNATLLKHGREYLNVLLAQNLERKALDLVRECQALDRAFQPTDANDVQRLARRASELAMPQVALDLVMAFLRATPKHRDTPANALVAAKVMTDRMNLEGKAHALLSQVRKAFPEHPAMPEVESYLKFLESLGAGKPQPVPESAG